MRPLKHPPLTPKIAKNWPLGAALLQAFGPFCAISERPLPSEILVWNPKDNTVHKDNIGAGQHFASSLPISPEFAKAARTVDPTTLTLPHIDLTHGLRKRPFEYKLMTVKVTMTDSADAPPPTAQKLAVVHGITKKAQALVDGFSLNGAGFDAKNMTLSLKYNDSVAFQHNLIFVRTRAWETAAGIADILAEIKDPDHPLVQQARAVAGSIGFWSCWLTVFENAKIPTPIIRSVLGGGNLVDGNLAATQEDGWAGHGPANNFPGTHPAGLAGPDG